MRLFLLGYLVGTALLVLRQKDAQDTMKIPYPWIDVLLNILIGFFFGPFLLVLAYILRLTAPKKETK